MIFSSVMSLNTKALWDCEGKTSRASFRLEQAQALAYSQGGNSFIFQKSGSPSTGWNSPTKLYSFLDAIVGQIARPTIARFQEYWCALIVPPFVLSPCHVLFSKTACTALDLSFF